MPETIERHDVVVIGGGVAGAAAAAFLAAAGTRVVLVEREDQPGYHTTGRSAALYTPHYGAPVVRRLNLAGGAFYRDLPPGFADAPVMRRRGALYIASDDGMALLEAEHTAARNADPASERLTPDAACALVPILRRGYVRGAFLDPAAADLDVGAILQGFLRQARHAGARTVTTAEVTAIERHDEGWCVRLGQRALTAPVVVDAAGAWADHVAALAGLGGLGIEPRRRTVILVDPPAGQPIERWPAVANLPETFYVKPDAGRLLCSPADETPDVPCDVQPDELDVAICVDRVQTAMDIEVRRIAHRWAGLRSFAPDRVPVAGFDPRGDGFFWLAGQGGYGIMTAPALAAISTHLITAAPLPPWLGEIDLAALAPARLL